MDADMYIIDKMEENSNKGEHISAALSLPLCGINVGIIFINH